MNCQRNCHLFGSMFTSQKAKYFSGILDKIQYKKNVISVIRRLDVCTNFLNSEVIKLKIIFIQIANSCSRWLTDERS